MRSLPLLLQRVARRMGRLARTAGLTALAATLVAGPSAAQDPRAAIQGRITDTSGAAVPGVTVTITNTSTGTRNTAASNENGVYAFQFVTPGTYDIVVVHSCIK